MRNIFIFLLIFSLLSSCNNTIKISNIEDAPKFQEEDKAYADVYKILDGKWKGLFQIMEDPNPLPIKDVDLKNLTLNQVKSPKFKLMNEIEVEQIYTSESPYFQRVQITDYYPDTKKKEISTGVNKIQNGKMWCVVKKPSEMIIHEGSTLGKSTIIWQSKQDSPQKVEYFQETVGEEYYEILGYGYYEGDDLNLSPRLWFYGKYQRQ